MGGIFSKPKIPDTSAQMKAQADAMAKQSALLDKQEARLDAQEMSAQRRAQASSAARRRGRGGTRLLLSSARGNAATGIAKGSGTTLGA